MMRLGQILLFYCMLLWLGLMLLGGNLLCLPLVVVPRSLREPRVQAGISRLFQLFLSGAARCGLMRLDLDALDALNGKRRIVLVANHPSMIDVFLVISRVRHAICLMKSSLRSNAFLAVGAYMAGYVSNRHTDLMLRDGAQAVERGALLLAFPEGTRTTRQPINALKPGVGLIAKRAGAPLQTLLIESNSAYLAKGWNIFRPPAFPLMYRVTVGQQIDANGTVTETMSTLQSYFERELTSSIDPALRV